MAPPCKRRRLTLFDSPSTPSTTEMADLERVAIHPHSVSDLAYNSDIPGVRSVPTHIEEIHVQIQQQATGVEQKPALRRRQIINSIVSALEGSASSTSGVATTNPTGIGGVFPSSSLPPPFASSSAFPSLSIGSVSSNGTAIRTTHSTTLPWTYTATLTNHNVKTITRSPAPYVTTFGDGQVSTICNRYGICKIGQTTAGKPTDSAPFLSQTPSSGPSSAAAIAAGSSSPTTPAPSASSTSSSTHHDNTDTAAPPPATIAGGAVGGIAGVAFLVLLALIFVRMYKRRSRNGHLALPAGDGMGGSSGRSGMVERAGLTSLANVLPPLFRHQNKSHESSAAASTERGFTKVAGRKLPSVWSEGMTCDDDALRSPPPTMPLKNNQSTGNLVLDRDSAGSYCSTTGDGRHSDEIRGTGSISPDPSPFADQLGTSPVSMTLSPGPQRTPTFHQGGPWIRPPSHHASVPLQELRAYRKARNPSPEPPLQPQQQGRSASPSTLGDRNSRYQEDV